MWSARLSPAVLVLAVVACKPAPSNETANAADSAATATHAGDSAAANANANTAAPAHTGNSKIDEALSAAPASISQNATVMDWPDSIGGKPKELRAGTNDWTCFPSTPTTVGASGQDPMCLDREFLAWGQALTNHKPPQVKGIGIGYMLRGDHGASNIDPYATKATADNEWVEAGPHLMVVTANTAHLATIPTDPKNGGPWVMWKGTPYAHIMVPAGGDVAMGPGTAGQ